MDESRRLSCIAFEGARCIASGELSHVVMKTKKVLDRGERAPVLIFDDTTSELIEVDFRGSVDEVLERLAETTSGVSSAGPVESLEKGVPRGPGRPKLGVVAHEVTLLPRHWDWLNRQPGGASVTLRKLVEEAKRTGGDKERMRISQESTYRFMSAMAGDRPGFEEATRALFAGNQERFDELVEPWPSAIRDHSKKLAGLALGGPSQGA